MTERRSPIFVHSMFRTGSTYIFNAFRRSPAGYWSYQEPLNEWLLKSASSPQSLLEIHEQTAAHLRHPKLAKPYFFEFYALASEVGRLFRKEFPYDQYFGADAAGLVQLKTYFSALIDGAQGRPVLQCCRSAGRVAQGKSLCGGVHLYLWRNPRDQWWSYKLDFYFDRSNLLIANAPSALPFVARLRGELGIESFHSADIWSEINHFTRQRLDAVGSYTLFYALWCHAMLEARPHCDLSINMDRLSTVEGYRAGILERLADLGIGGLDLSDAAMPIGIYGKKDNDFFSGIEDRVHGLLLWHGYSQAQLDEMLEVRREFTTAAHEVTNPMVTLARDAERARDTARRFETELHGELVEVNRLTQKINAKEKEHQELQARAQWLANEWDAAKSKLKEHQELQARAQWLANEWDAAKSKLVEVQQSSYHWKAIADQLSRDLRDVHGSTSWRVTKPLRQLRLVGAGARALSANAARWGLRLPKRLTKPLMLWCMRQILSRPVWTERALSMLAGYPGLKQRLRTLAAHSGLVASWPDASTEVGDADVQGGKRRDAAVPEEWSHLGETARRMYFDIKTAIEQRERKTS